MNIVILDGQILNPGDISWEEFEKLGKVTIYDKTAPEELLEKAKDADILITNKVRLDATSIASLPNLKYIGVLATGYDVIDIEAAAKHNIPVCNVVAYGVGTVAQHVMALILELCKNINLHCDSVKNGEWNERGEWCYWLSPLRDLGSMTMGIVGFGNIGREVGKMAHALGMKIQAYSPTPKEKPNYPCEFVSIEELFASSDVISLHCPLNDKSRHLINAQSLVNIKKGAILINTARGALVEEEATAKALHSGHLGGLGTDVLSVEPPNKDNPLLTAPNCLITPHIAWATREARANIIYLSAKNIQAWQDGKIQNAVNVKFLNIYR